MTSDRDLTRESHDDRGRGARGDEGDGLVLREEELRVRTERVPYGRVTFRKRVVTEERTIVVTVRREELEILEDDSPAAPVAADEGRFDAEAGIPGDPMGYAEEPALRGERLDSAADHPGADDLRRTPEGDFDIVLRAEEPVVTVKTVPVERVHISRAIVTDTERVSAEVDREEAVVEQDIPRGHGRPDRD